jgi:hypothetical protein
LVDQECKDFLDEFEGVEDNIYTLIKIDVMDSNTGTIQQVYAYLLDQFKESLLEGAIMLENYSSINPHYGSYKIEDDKPENNDFVLKQIK